MPRSLSGACSLATLLAMTTLAGCADFRASRAFAPALMQKTALPPESHTVLVCETRGASMRSCSRQSLREINERVIERLAVHPYSEY